MAEVVFLWHLIQRSPCRGRESCLETSGHWLGRRAAGQGTQGRWLASQVDACLDLPRFLRGFKTELFKRGEKCRKWMKKGSHVPGPQMPLHLETSRQQSTCPVHLPTLRREHAFWLNGCLATLAKSKTTHTT